MSSSSITSFTSSKASTHVPAPASSGTSTYLVPSRYARCTGLLFPLAVSVAFKFGGPSDAHGLPLPLLISVAVVQTTLTIVMWWPALFYKAYGAVDSIFASDREMRESRLGEKLWKRYGDEKPDWQRAFLIADQIMAVVNGTSVMVCHVVYGGAPLWLLTVGSAMCLMMKIADRWSYSASWSMCPVSWECVREVRAMRACTTWYLGWHVALFCVNSVALIGFATPRFGPNLLKLGVVSPRMAAFLAHRPETSAFVITLFVIAPLYALMWRTCAFWNPISAGTSSNNGAAKLKSLKRAATLKYLKRAATVQLQDALQAKAARMSYKLNVVYEMIHAMFCMFAWVEPADAVAPSAASKSLRRNETVELKDAMQAKAERLYHKVCAIRDLVKSVVSLSMKPFSAISSYTVAPKKVYNVTKSYGRSNGFFVRAFPSLPYLLIRALHPEDCAKEVARLEKQDAAAYNSDSDREEIATEFDEEDEVVLSAGELSHEYGAKEDEHEDLKRTDDSVMHSIDLSNAHGQAEAGDDDDDDDEDGEPSAKRRETEEEDEIEDHKPERDGVDEILDFINVWLYPLVLFTVLLLAGRERPAFLEGFSIKENVLASLTHSNLHGAEAQTQIDVSSIAATVVVAFLAHLILPGREIVEFVHVNFGSLLSILMGVLESVSELRDAKKRLARALSVNYDLDEAKKHDNFVTEQFTMEVCGIDGVCRRIESEEPEAEPKAAKTITTELDTLSMLVFPDEEFELDDDDDEGTPVPATPRNSESDGEASDNSNSGERETNVFPEKLSRTERYVDSDDESHAIWKADTFFAEMLANNAKFGEVQSKLEVPVTAGSMSPSTKAKSYPQGLANAAKKEDKGKKVLHHGNSLININNMNIHTYHVTYSYSDPEPTEEASVPVPVVTAPAHAKPAYEFGCGAVAAQKRRRYGARRQDTHLSRQVARRVARASTIEDLEQKVEKLKKRIFQRQNTAKLMKQGSRLWRQDSGRGLADSIVFEGDEDELAV